MFVDSHCHLDCLDLTHYDGSLDRALDACTAANVTDMLCVCIDLENFPAVYAIAQRYHHIHASVGLHPTSEPGTCEDPTFERLCELGSQDKVVAIGETGLDYYRHTAQESDWQRARFRTHIRAAIALDKPLIIHTRDAQADTIAIMREEGAQQCRGVMHCFTETWEMAEQAMELGFMISISGIVTFKNAVQLQDVAKRIPLDRLLIETDAPYLAPVPFRGKPNEPAYVPYVAHSIAALRGEPVERIAQATRDNYFSLFKIKAFS